MSRLAAVILTYNEAHNVDWCVLSLRDRVDAVVVWDSGSTDDTVARAQRAGALVVQRPFDNYASQRQAALATVAADWILFVDADERVTPALMDEVHAAIAGAVVTAGAAGAPADSAAGYWIPRRNWIVGHEMHGGGFTPDYQLRLLKRSEARYDLAREVHEVVMLDGAAGYLKEPLIHYNYLTWEQFAAKQKRYAAYEARILAARGIRPRPHNFVLQPLREFRRRFITLRGYRDGWFGFGLAARLAWYYGFVPYRLLEEQEKN
jgi:glycosyltransferase involved in cell wall biosynthesis